MSSRPLADAALLRQIPLFSSLTAVDAERLLPAVHTCRFPAGHVIFEEGEPVRGFYLLRSGCVKIYKLSMAGQEQVLSVVQPGQTFAEAAVFGGNRYPAYTQCLENSELLLVERDALLTQLQHDPTLALRMLAGMAMKLRRLVSLVEDLTLRDARGRICRYLLSFLPEEAVPPITIKLPVRHMLVSRLLGITSETFSRTLKSLRDEGVLESGERGQIVIHDAAALRAQAGESVL